MFALFDPNSFFITELSSFYFCYIILETIAREVLFGRGSIDLGEEESPSGAVV